MGPMAKKAFVWGRADGRARVHGWSYRRVLAVYGGSLIVLAVAPVVGRRLSGPWVGVAAWAAASTPLILVTARRTRWKYRWVRGRAKYLYLPFGHLLQVAAQTLGYVVGTLETYLGRA